MQLTRGASKVEFCPRSRDAPRLIFCARGGTQQMSGNVVSSNLSEEQIEALLNEMNNVRAFE